MSCQCFHLSKCFLVFYTGSSIWYVRKNFRKKYIFCLLIRTRMCAYQGVRNISFFRKFCLRAIWMIPMVCCGILENIEKIGLLERNNEKCPYSEFFWSVFSRIRTKNGDLRSRSPYLVWIRKKTDQTNSEYSVLNHY